MNTPINIVGLFKAKAAVEEDGERVLFIEASREDLDQEDEIVLCRALKESADYFKTFGNVDLDHITQLKPQNIKNPYLFEIGKPIDVISDENNVTLVKVQLYKGNGPSAELANYVWSSLTQQEPPMVWYASVGGEITDTMQKKLPDGKSCDVITGVRWNNLALSKTPCLTTLNPASLTPIGAFAKSAVKKAIDTFSETDSAEIEGYQALIPQSLDTGAEAGGKKEQLARFIRNLCSCSEETADEIADQILSTTHSSSQEGETMKNAIHKAQDDDDEVKDDTEVVVQDEAVEDEAPVTDSNEEEVVVVEDESAPAQDEAAVVVEDEENPLEKSDDTDEEVVLTKDVVSQIIDQLGEITKALDTLAEKLTSNDEIVKSLDKSVKTLQKAGLGRRGVASVTSNLSLSSDTVLTKCLKLQAEAKISAADTVVIDDSVKRGFGIPEKFVHLFN